MNRSAWDQLAIVLVLAFVVRLGVGWAWESRLSERFFFGDSASYWTLGQAIADGAPYEYGSARVFRAPGYPLLLSPIFVLFGSDASVGWARAQSAMFGSLAVAGVWWLGRRLFDTRVGLTAALIAAFHPGTAALGALVLSEAPFCALMLLHLSLWMAAWKADSPPTTAGLAVCGGVVAGLATLVRPSWLLFIPFALMAALWFGKHRLRHLEIGAAMLVGFIVAMGPWWIRNARVTGRFVPSTLQVGASMYDGLNPHATGASNMGLVDEEVSRIIWEFRRDGQIAPEDFEYELDRRLRDESFRWVRDNPRRALALAGKKFVRLWNFWPNENAFSAWYIRLAVLATYVPLMVLAATGAWKTLHWGWPYVLCWMPAAYFTLLHIVFVSSLRYRLPAMLPLMVLASATLWLKWDDYQGKPAKAEWKDPGAGRTETH